MKNFGLIAMSFLFLSFSYADSNLCSSVTYYGNEDLDFGTMGQFKKEFENNNLWFNSSIELTTEIDRKNGSSYVKSHDCTISFNKNAVLPDVIKPRTMKVRAVSEFSGSQSKWDNYPMDVSRTILIKVVDKYIETVSCRYWYGDRGIVSYTNQDDYKDSLLRIFGIKFRTNPKCLQSQND